MFFRNHYPIHLTLAECSELCACGHDRYAHWNGETSCSADCRCNRFVREVDYLRNQVAALTAEVRRRK